jgi:hypothetical protein
MPVEPASKTFYEQLKEIAHRHDVKFVLSQPRQKSVDLYIPLSHEPKGETKFRMLKSRLPQPDQTGFIIGNVRL